MWGLMGGAGGPDTAVGTSEGEKRPRWKLRLRPCRLRLRHKRHASVGHCSGRGDREGPPWSLAVLWVKRVLVATEKGHLICTPEGDVLTLAPPPPRGRLSVGGARSELRPLETHTTSSPRARLQRLSWNSVSVAMTQQVATDGSTEKTVLC